MDNILLSLVMTLFWSSILISLLAVGRKKRLFRDKFGITCAVASGIICMLRLFLPYDFGLQIQIRCPGIFSDIFDFFVLDSHTLGRWEFHIWDIILAVWLSVAAVLCICSIFRYLRFRRMVRKKFYINRNFNGIIHSIQEEYGKRKTEIPVYQGEVGNVPLSVGIIRPVIVLPVQSYSEEELLCILAHEYTHIRYHDPAWKWMCQILCCIFWWNPFAYLLQRDLGELLENRCDLTVIRSIEGVGPADYMQTIIRTMKDTRKGLENLPCSTMVDRHKGKAAEKAVKERFRLIAEGYPVSGNNKYSRTFFYGILAALVIASYSMVWIPAYDPPAEDFEGAYVPDPDTDYLEMDEDGNFYVNFADSRMEISQEAAKIFIESGLKFR